MKNRSSYAVLTRFGIIAAILATLVLIAPAVSAADPLEFSYPENGEDPVATFIASDPDADADDIEWSLEGVDAGLFEIEGGVLTWKESPSYETAKDADEVPDDEVAGDQGKGDNKYQITVVASGGKQAVEVEVTDVDEMGKVTFTRPQPQIDRPLMAKGGAASDPDGGIDVSESTWQWSRGPSADGPWTDIEGGAAKRASRQPEEADIGMWLRATSSYSDKFGDKTVSGVTENFVEERTLANSRPSFGDLDDSDEETAGIQVARNLNENADGAFGDPIVATDGDNDVLLYSVDSGLDRDIDDDATFSINDRTGQLSVKKDGLNFESAADVAVITAEATATAAGATPDNEAGNNEYVVLVRATDPSGAYQTVPVVITVKDANEPPKLADGKDQKTLYAAENVENTGLFTAAALTDDSSPTTYTATDEDADDLDTAITFTLEGANEDDFTIAAAGTGTVTTAADAKFDYEDKKELSITLVVTSGGDAAAERGDRERITKLAITIKVQNAEDDGEVKISQPEPQVGRSVFATLDDKDGGQRDVKWKWYRGGTSDTTAGELTTLVGTLTADPLPEDCSETLEASRTVACLVADGSPLYSPGDDDAPYRLHAVATYLDDFVTDEGDNDTDDGDSAVGSTERPVQISDPANTAPKFDSDQDPNTPGNQADAVRSVEENKKSERVGDPVAATDGDGDLMAYVVSGPDAALFKTDNNGQITTAEELDYEGLPDDAKYHMVMLTATDPSGASDSVTVIINVTDGPDDAEISSAVVGVQCSGADPVKCTYAENGEDPVATFSASDPDADADDIEWSLEGVDAGLFEIEGGVLTWKESPSYETAKDADEVPDDEVAGDQGKGDNKYQITVVASGGKQAVEVEVTDVDEAGKVTFTRPQPQVDRPLMAKGGAASDPDGGIDVSESTWQWSRGPSADGPWTDIEGGAAKRASRQPEEADIGMWLRATSSYSDKFGDKTVSGVTENFVEERTLANSRPSFGDLDDSDEETAGIQVARNLNENADGAFGDPIVATDGDNDVLLYSVDSGLDRDIDDDATFSINDRTGQLSVKKDGLNFESAADVAVITAEATATAAGATPDNEAGNNEYVVLVRATDPSGASHTVPVVITVKDANEPPKLADGKDQKTLYAAENVENTGLFTAAALTDDSSPTTYTATDEDADDLDTAITFTLEGADEDDFTIAAAGTGTVTTAADAKFDYEDKKELSITLVVTSGGDAAAERGDRERITKLAITIKVQNAEDDGEVKISQPEPQVGRSVFATLDDKDGGQRDVKWKWYRGGTSDTTAGELTELVGTLTADPLPEDCSETLEASRTVACLVADGSPLYSPGDDDAPYRLHAVATYLDDFVTDEGDNDTDDGDSAVGSTERPVQISNPANTAPKFDSDQDPNTLGNQADAVRSVEENKKSERVGDPVAATDGDGDLMAYVVSGPDAALFKTDNNGQITTAEELDYEGLPDDAKYHMVMLTATDPSGASDSVTVIINVTDGPDDAEISLLPAENVAPAFADDAAEFMVYENMADGTEVGMVMATDGNNDTLTYSDDSGYFNVDDMGNITTTMMLDHEAMASHSVTVTATDSDDATDTIDVTIAVGDMYPGCTVEGNNGQTNDCEILLGAKETLMGEDATRMLDWSEDTPIADWHGVRKLSESGRVEWLYLHGVTGKDATDDDPGRAEVKLNGTIPAELGELTEMTRLYLHRNNLAGEIPSELNGLTNLVWLRLYDNMLSGEVPDLSGMTSLERFYIHVNQLTGGVPTGLSDSVTHILLHRNMLTGEIPDLSGIDNLVWLSLYGNMLDSAIPATVGDIGNLEVLYLHENMLMGEVPAELAALSNLRSLWLKNNMLSGALPGELDNLMKLTLVRISGNAFTDCVPEGLTEAEGRRSDAAELNLPTCGEPGQ